MYVYRINLSTAIVAMVGVEKAGSSKSYNVSDTCPERFSNTTKTREIVNDAEFDWDKKQQGLLMGSYYWSYTAAQIPAAWLAAKYGFRLVFGVSMLLSGIVTLLFPVCARVNVYLALVARVLIGLFHAVAFPAMTGAWGAWGPPAEVTK